MNAAKTLPEPSTPDPAHGPYTWDDFIALDEDDLRELIDGDLIEVEVPTGTHESVVAALLGNLWSWSQAGNRARVLASGYKIRISERRGIMPDIQLYLATNLTPRAEQGLVEGRPDLVVEVITPSSRRYDRMIKLRWYTEKGVPEYWIVDPMDQSVERLLLREGAYLIASGATDREIFRPESFEGLAIDLALVWDLPPAPVAEPSKL